MQGIPQYYFRMVPIYGYAASVIRSQTSSYLDYSGHTSTSIERVMNKFGYFYCSFMFHISLFIISYICRFQFVSVSWIEVHYKKDCMSVVKKRELSLPFEFCSVLNQKGFTTFPRRSRFRSRIVLVVPPT